MLTNKIIILTGGSGFIGQEFCKSISSNDGTVVIADINENLEESYEKIIDKDDNLDFQFLDITSKNSIHNIIDYTHKKYGKIDAWINNAYVTSHNNSQKREYTDDFLKMSYDEFCNSLQFNLGGTFLCSQLITKYFIKQEYGNIINISSMYGVIAPRFDIYEDTDMTMPADYAVNKSALIHFTKYLAKFLKGKNIRVNCISPGGVLKNQPEIFIDNYKEFSLNKSMLNKKDISGTLIFLLSHLSNSINGQNIIVDDGWTL